MHPGAFPSAPLPVYQPDPAPLTSEFKTFSAFIAVWPPANPMSKQYRKGNCENRVDSPVCGCTGTRVCVCVRVFITSLQVKVEDCVVSGKNEQKVFAILGSLPKLPIQRSSCATHHVMAVYETST